MIDNKRYKRKIEHLNIFMEEENKSPKDYFETIKLIHNALPEINFDEIDLSTKFLSKNIDYPIMINAITGGVDEAYNINKDLASLANKYNIPIAVGSQSIALRGDGNIESFKVVREINDKGIVLANLSAAATYDEVQSVVELIEADAIQLHLNVAQEIIMNEGDRAFRGLISNIQQIKNKLKIPIVIKEVGFGISHEVAKHLLDIGIDYIDVGGKGGTNFIKIESKRNDSFDFSELYDWGIPTPDSIKMCRSVSDNLHIISSGGIRKADQIIKSLCLGADIVGLSGYLLRILIEEGFESVDKKLDELIYKVRVIMLLLGCKVISELNSRQIITY